MKMKGSKNKKWDIDKFKEDTVIQNYHDTLKKELHNEEDETTIQKDWENIKEAIIVPAERQIGEKKLERNEEWFDKECKKAVEEKNKYRQITLQKETRRNCEIYKESRRKAFKICQKKKREFIEKK
jgi:hypothetical protein